eukprot:TRINITY_DN315_c0_g1_i2.p1 TRINITY_DN315_c0_g1~~TRINITY_DN315_c0_g1_i2.p1  ORF type:complete len:337 (-),score=53.28 TRINITY_DN315_c0_g1_i2:459-1469(-)
MSFMEMSHRDAGGPVHQVMTQAVDDVKELLQIPDNYHVLFMQGGAHGQFSAIPLNLLGDKTSADYLDTGFWSTRAIGEGSKHAKINVVAKSSDHGYTRIPSVDEWQFSNDAAYVHICANETIHGLEFHEDPTIPDGVPLVGDFTSTLLSRPVDIAKYGLIYASGGKNLGPAGMTMVIIRDDLVKDPKHHTPSVLSYKEHRDSLPIPSIYNTPSTFVLYVMGKCFKAYLNRGGLKAIQERAIKNANGIYRIVDSSKGFYQNNVEKVNRSRMNIPFRINNSPQLETLFTEEAEERGLLQLFGHPLHGGMRVTLYNGITNEAVEAVSDYMIQFKNKYDK